MIDIHSTQFIKETQKAARKILHVIGRKKSVGICADINYDSLIMVFACIKLGLKVAFCPLREPPKVIDSWLKSLNINLLFASKNDFKHSDIAAEQFLFSNLVKENNKIVLVDKSKSFSSIIRTSGSTSCPKSAKIFFDAHMVSAKAVSDYFLLSNKDIFVLNLPLYHVSGLSILFRAIASGCKVFLSPTYEDLVYGLNNKLATHISLVPFLLQKLLDNKICLAHLKAVFVGGDVIPSSLAKRARLKNINLFESYGLTELASTVFIKNYQHKNTGFRVLPHVDFRVAADQELFLKSKSLSAGYVGQKKFLKEGYFYTSDLFERKTSGLHFLGRKNNRIISGGENIQAEEVEHAINTHPMVKRSLVIDKFDENFGQRPIAYVDCEKEVLLTLKDFLKPKLAAFKIPISFFSWPKIESESHKINRRKFKKSISNDLS